MKVTVLKETLHKATTIVGKGISTKTQLPVLSNILLEAKNGQLTLSCTNLETSISYWIGAQVDEEGSLTVPARIFTDLISTFTQEKIDLTGEKNHLDIVCGESEATLTGIEASEFPPLPKSLEEVSLSLDKNLFGSQLPFILISASNDEGRPLLTGVRFVVDEDKLLMVATDGFRLSLKELPKQPQFLESCVISAKVLSEVFRLAQSEEGKSIGLIFSTDKNQVIFQLEQAKIATRLIEGEYPQFSKIIPAGFTTRAVIDRGELTAAVKFSSVYARESANIIKFKVMQNQIILTANSPQIGENKTSVSARVEGEGGEIAFNSRFLTDLLSVFPDDQIVLEMSGPLAPGVFKSPTDTSYLHIIMPVRVQN